MTVRIAGGTSWIVGTCLVLTTLSVSLGPAVADPSAQASEPAAVSGGLRTLLALGVATSIDALAVGLLLALLQVSLLVPILIIGVVTFVISYAGVVAGHELRRAFSTWGRRGLQLLGGLILIGIGVKIVWEHFARGSAGAS